MEEVKYIKNMQKMVVISASTLLVLVLLAWLREGFLKDWKRIQGDYHRMVQAGDTVMVTHIPAGRKIYQVTPEHLDRVDRCVSCHSGLENPLMEDVPQPHTFHPGDYLVSHPVHRFGCTICHGGQGRALTKKEAFGQEPETHWPYPLLGQPYIQSSCGKCHLAIYTDGQQLDGTEVFHDGKGIFGREGCLGCHKARGVGGILGPDLTEQGEKTKHEYSFQNIAGDQTISNWLKEHFRDPEMVSPGSQMLKIDLPEEELEALVTFVMGLSKPDIPFEYFSLETLNEFKGKRDQLPGNKLYPFFCSACHGKGGEGKDYTQYKTGVPSIQNPDFIRVASAEFIHFTLRKGRSERQMTSWAAQISGWKEGEIDSVVHYLENRKVSFPAFNPAELHRGDTARGELIYLGSCAMCHGPEGNGGIGLALRNEDFLGMTSDRFIYETLLQGRDNTAMPAWPGLSTGELADLMTYIRGWSPVQGSDAQIPLPAGNVNEGSLSYHYLCSRCHGEFGEGNTGPAILSRSFTRAASDAYLYGTISRGRSNTAMFGWTEDVYGQERLDKQGISNIISYMRAAGSGRKSYIYAGANPGNASRGRDLFQSNCAKCHGTRGEGTGAPALNNQEFLNAASNGYLLATISLGRKETRMPSWGRGGNDYPLLDGKERQDIVAFIRNWQRIRIAY